jgi:3-isopropylmalate/(R)-2-methylmalate dehydratase large subunit
MAIEIGAKCGLMKADAKVLSWLKDKTNKKFTPVDPDDNAKYREVKEYEADEISPQIAKPHAVDNVCPVKEIEGTKINQGFIGTCANGRLEDLKIATAVLKGKKIKNNVRLIIAPASKRIYLEAIKKGIVSTLIESGAVFVTPGCGPCVGTHNGVPSNEEKVISTANRNFLGRMGNPKAEIYLASPATVAASMLEGKITDPRKYY